MSTRVLWPAEFPRLCLAMALILGGSFTAGCDARRRDPGTCFQEDCDPGFMCTKSNQCVRAMDGGAWDLGQIDVRQGMEGGAAPQRIDGSAIDLFSPVDTSVDVPITLSPIDGGVALDSATEAATVDAAALDSDPGDSLLPDAAGTCGSNNDCTGKDAPFCVQARCVSCKSSDQCGGGSPLCSASHACVSCAVVDAGCPSATPACEADSGRCLECLGDGDCRRDANKSFCQSGLCVGCGGASATACSARDPGNPVCLPGGTCTECATSNDCKSPAKPICDTTANTCVACTRDDQCQSKVDGPGVCLFQLDGHCATDVESVYVGKNGAGACSDAGAGSAQMPYCTAQTAIGVAKSAGTPVVVVMGQVSGFSLGALSAPLTIVGKGGVITPADYADGVSITRGEVYLRALTVAGNPSGVTGMGISAQAATGATVVLHMDGCTVRDNPGGGILLVGAAFDIRNSKVTGNGPGQTADGSLWGGIHVESLPAAGETSLNLVTIQKNLATGLSCSGAIQGRGILATGNTTLEIGIACAVTSCSTPSPTCGVQP